MASAAEFKGKAGPHHRRAVEGSGCRVAEQLAEAGAQVFINGRSAERGEQAVAKLREISQDAPVHRRGLRLVSGRGDRRRYRPVSGLAGSTS